MEGSWPQRPLGEVTENFDAVRVPVKEADRRAGPYPYYGASGIVDHVQDFLFDGEYLLVSEDGENLRTRKTPVAFLARGRFWVNNHAHIVRGNHEASTRFLSYALQVADIESYLTGTTMPKLTQANLNRIPVPVPPLGDQRAIAEVLGALDDQIDLNRRMNETLEALARALFKSWFVDFDPVRARAKGRQPAGMEAETAALFPVNLVETRLGRTPAGWPLSTLDQSIVLLSGGTPRTSEKGFWNGPIPWFSVKDAPQEGDVWVVATEKTITEEGLENCASQLLPVGTTIISARGTVGRMALTGVPMAMNQSCYGVRGVNVATEVFTFFTLMNAVDELQSKTHGTVFDTITRQTFSAIEVVAAPVELQRRFDAVAMPLLARIKANLFQSRTLQALRESLLPKLMSGELRVMDAETAVATTV